MNKTILGWIAITEQGDPYQPRLGNCSWRNQRVKPITVYSTEKRAAQYSPVNTARPVYWKGSD